MIKGFLAARRLDSDVVSFVNLKFTLPRYEKWQKEHCVFSVQ